MNTVHERTDDGRDRHYMVKKDGVWTCECGETRNQYGEPSTSLSRYRMK